GHLDAEVVYVAAALRDLRRLFLNAYVESCHQRFQKSGSAAAISPIMNSCEDLLNPDYKAVTWITPAGKDPRRLWMSAGDYVKGSIPVKPQPVSKPGSAGPSRRRGVTLVIKISEIGKNS